MSLASHARLDPAPGAGPEPDSPGEVTVQHVTVQPDPAPRCAPPQAQPRLGPVVLVLALAYPVLTHAGARLGSTPLVFTAVATLLVLMLLRPLARGRAWAWVALAAATAGLAWLAVTGRDTAALLALYLPPVVLYLAVAWVFARSLRGPGPALITALAQHLHGAAQPLPPQIAAYTRRLTWFWALLLVAIASVNAGLALLATPDGVLELLGLTPPFQIARSTWSLLANMLSFPLVLLAMVAEYAFRWWRFPAERGRFRSLYDFVDRMRTALPAIGQAQGR